ncbi:MAG: outer membrane protein transport protein [Schleiferiaceae bacterium]|nr:outer membrane protein transport protein [Schleiferiaceae bacterium]
MSSKWTFLLCGLFLTGLAKAQTPEEAALFSEEGLFGTPRYQAMSGAFTSLGNDLSGLRLNPAGIGVFRHNELNVTFDYLDKQHRLGPFYGTTGIHEQGELSLSNIGLALPLRQASKGDFEWALGINFNKTSDLNRSYTIIGSQPNNYTLGEYWGESSANQNVDNISNDAFAAWQAYLLVDTMTPPPDEEIFIRDTNASYAFGTLQPDGSVQSSATTEFEVQQYGSSGITEFSFGGNYDRTFFYGLTIGIPTLNYTRESFITEYINEQDAAPYNARNYTYRRRSDLSATGFNFKLGFIYTPSPLFRLGASYQSPSWFQVDQTYEYDIAAQFNGPPLQGVNANTESETFSTNQYHYALCRPAVYRLGISSVIDEWLILSADYHYTAPQNTDLRRGVNGFNISPEKLATYQTGIDNFFSPTQNTFAVGTEIRLNQRFYLRGGYRYQTSVYKRKERDFTVSNRQGFSAGLGAQFNQLLLNLSFSQQRRDLTDGTYTYRRVQVLQDVNIRQRLLHFSGGLTYRF